MKKKPSQTTSETDWDRLDQLGDDDIDLSDDPELTAEQFARAFVREGLPPRPAKTQVTLRLDSDVLTWFRARGKGYQTQINDLLRAFMQAERQRR